MVGSYGAGTPVETHAGLEISGENTDSLVAYLALDTRPGVSYAVKLLSRYNSDP